MEKVMVFSAKPYDREFLSRAVEGTEIQLKFVEARLSEETAQLAAGYKAICIFVNDKADAQVIQMLHDCGVGFIALRCAGFNNVDLHAAEKLGVCVARVPAYSPNGVAEHAVGLMMVLNRKIHRAHNRVRESNFALNGLLGFDMHGKTAGIIGTGKIGEIVALILKNGFGCNVVAYDIKENPKLVEAGITYLPLDELFARCDILSLHCPLIPQTYHMVNRESMAKMKKGVMIINTSRGALVDSQEVVEALKSGQIGYLGMDVYEEEADLFFEDLSNRVIQDDVFARLQSFPNVIITGHQAYFTQEALSNIADTTVDNIRDFFAGKCCANAVYCDRLRHKNQ